jgi:hypothetical protein
MADTAVHSFTQKTTLVGTDETYVVQSPFGSGDDRRASMDNVDTYLAQTTKTLTNKTIDLGSNTLTMTSLQLKTALSDETGSGAAVFATTPTLITPVLGVATGTSLALGGATIGSDALGITGTSTFGGNVTIASASQLLWSTDLILTRKGAASLQLGAADAAAPVAQTLQVQSVVAGTSNTVGTNWTLKGSAGTGTGIGGNIVFQVALAGSTGTAQNSLTTALTIVPTATAPQLQLSSAGAANVPVLSGGNSNVGLYFGSSGLRLHWTYGGNNALSIVADTSVNLNSGMSLGWTSSNNTDTSADLLLRRAAAASLQLGAADVDTAPVAQTIRSQGLLAGGTSNQAGANWTFIASPGKGTGAGGSFIFQTTPAGSTGTTVGTATTALTIDSTQLSTFAGRAFINTLGASATPALAIGVSNSGIYRRSGSRLTFVVAGSDTIELGDTTVGLEINGGCPISWSASTSGTGTAPDLFLLRLAAANLQIGAAASATPVAQIFSTQGSRAGTDTNVGGGNLTINSGNGTGTGTLSTLILQSPIAVGSGTGAQTQTTGLTVKAGTAVLTSYTVANLPAAGTAGAGATAFVTDASTTLLLGLGGTVTGGGANKTPVYSDGTNWIYG